MYLPLDLRSTAWLDPSLQHPSSKVQGSKIQTTTTTTWRKLAYEITVITACQETVLRHFFPIFQFVVGGHTSDSKIYQGSAARHSEYIDVSGTAALDFQW